MKQKPVNSLLYFFINIVLAFLLFANPFFISQFKQGVIVEKVADKRVITAVDEKIIGEQREMLERAIVIRIDDAPISDLSSRSIHEYLYEKTQQSNEQEYAITFYPAGESEIRTIHLPIQNGYTKNSYGGIAETDYLPVKHSRVSIVLRYISSVLLFQSSPALFRGAGSAVNSLALYALIVLNVWTFGKILLIKK